MQSKLSPLLFVISSVFLLTSISLSQINRKVNLQNITISGQIRDENTYKEVSRVNITIEGTQVGTTSNHAGKFTLTISLQYSKSNIIFQHIAYNKVILSMDSITTLKFVYLQPRVIQLQGVAIEEEGSGRLGIAKDLPQPVAIINAKAFEIRGYVDAGDLLRTDHSVQVEEELSGRKTISIRGGNSDEVIVLYNGIKMNSNYDNIFDLSLIDLEDIDRFEIIKGSNTALYGPEAFSGVINIVPKIQQDYTIRFQQRLGTYRSGNWGLHLYQKYNNLQGGYSFKQGGAKREFVDREGDDDSGLENKSTHHTANLSYSFAEHADGRPASLLSFMWISSSLDYENLRDSEFLDNNHQMGSLKYTQQTGKLKGLDISASYRKLDENQVLFVQGELERSIDDQSIYFDIEKGTKFGLVEFLSAYQFRIANLDFTDKIDSPNLQQIGLESADLKRQHHGFVSILKLHDELKSGFLKTFNMDVSFRHDRVRDEQENPIFRGEDNSQEDEIGQFNGNKWNENVFKFSIALSGYEDFLSFDSYLNVGSNVKFPTLFQQISSPLSLTSARFQPSLEPEKNRSIEVGFNVAREFRGLPVIYGWNISGNYFSNNYENKFRLSVTPGIPVTFYDNVKNADISGLEAEASVYMYKKKITLQYGLSKYKISEKAAFPFKSDFKHTFNLIIDHMGYSFQLHWFKEGEQIGWLRLSTSAQPADPNQPGFGEIALPSNSNLDLHLSKQFEIAKLKLFVNASGRNLLNSEDVILEGLAIRDRRFYVTMGMQY